MQEKLPVAGFMHYHASRTAAGGMQAGCYKGLCWSDIYVVITTYIVE